MEELLATLVAKLKHVGPQAEQIDLPIFQENADAAEWCRHVEAIKTEFEWSDVQLLARLKNYLTDDAKEWYESWLPANRTWEIFKVDFIEAFPPRKILGRLLVEASNFRSDQCNTYMSYVHKKLSLLKSLRASWSETELIELIIYGIDDSKLSGTATARNYQKLSDLVAFLNSTPKLVAAVDPNCGQIRNEYVTLGKRPWVDTGNCATQDFDTNHVKRFKPRNPNIRCYICGKLGHVKRECTSNVRNIIQEASSSDEKVKVKDELCNFCLKPGHDESSCFVKQGIEKRRKTVHHIASKNQKGAVPLLIKVDGETYMGLIDTGADVSLFSASFTDRFEAKLVSARTYLKTISGVVISEKCFDALVEISGHRANIHFSVVPEGCLDYEVLIGNDLFRDHNLAAVTDFNGTRVVNRQLPGILRIVESNPDFTETVVVPEKYKLQIFDLLNKFSSIITIGNAIMAVNNTLLEIHLIDSHVVNRRPYRLSPFEREEVRKIIADLLKNGIIRESNSPYASPILLVKKKNGTYRMVVDFRELNVHTVKDRFPLPRVDDQLDRLGRGKLFTSLDMASGFHQIPIHPDSVHKTAFVTPEGQYEYLRMPFGLANAPAVFQRAINAALGDLKNSIAIVYIDDILIPSVSVEEGLERLETVLKALKNAGFSLNLNKCRFLQENIEYLGREISGSGIKPGQKKYRL